MLKICCSPINTYNLASVKFVRLYDFDIIKNELNN